MDNINTALKKCKKPEAYIAFGQELALQLQALPVLEQLKVYEEVGKPLKGEALKHIVDGVNLSIKDKEMRKKIFNSLMGLKSISTYVNSRLEEFKNMPQTPEVKMMIQGANKLNEIQKGYKK